MQGLQVRPFLELSIRAARWRLLGSGWTTTATPKWTVATRLPASFCDRFPIRSLRWLATDEQTAAAAGLLRSLGVPPSCTSPRTACSTGPPSAPVYWTRYVRRKSAAWCSPLAQGLLTDRYLRGVAADSRAAVGHFLAENRMTRAISCGSGRFEVLAAERNQTVAELALAWVLRRPEVTSAIIGASSVPQLKQNIAALDNLALSETELDRIAAHPRRLVGRASPSFPPGRWARLGEAARPDPDESNSGIHLATLSDPAVRKQRSTPPALRRRTARRSGPPLFLAGDDWEGLPPGRSRSLNHAANGSRRQSVRRHTQPTPAREIRCGPDRWSPARLGHSRRRLPCLVQSSPRAPRSVPGVPRRHRSQRGWRAHSDLRGRIGTR